MGVQFNQNAPHSAQSWRFSLQSSVSLFSLPPFNSVDSNPPLDFSKVVGYFLITFRKVRYSLVSTGQQFLRGGDITHRKFTYATNYRIQSITNHSHI
jgi:hypothetical protein